MLKRWPIINNGVARFTGLRLAEGLRASFRNSTFYGNREYRVVALGSSGR